MSNLIIGYGTQGKKRAKILSFNKKKVFIYDPLYKNSKSNLIKYLTLIYVYLKNKKKNI